MIGRKLSVVLFLWFLVSGYLQAAYCLNTCESVPEVTISDATPFKSKGIQLRWKIVNPNETPIFIYSTFLEGRRAAVWIKRPDGVLEVHTSLASKLNMTAYSYPQAAFVKIEPRAAIEGVFSDPKPTIRARRSDQLVFTVAFGMEIESVKRALRDHFYHGEGHPANPIVDWQCIAVSNLAKIDDKK